MIYVKWYVSDFLGSTAVQLMDCKQVGAYTLLLNHCYNMGGMLPDDDRILARLARMTPEEWATDGQLVRDQFEPHPGGGLTQRRVQEAITEYDREVSQKRLAGRKSAERRWGQKVTAVITADTTAVERPSNGCGNGAVTIPEARSQKPDIPPSTSVDAPPQVTKPAPEVKAHAFERSPFFDKHRFAAEMQSRVPEMTRDEMAYWYGQAEASSNKGNKYKNWVRAILSWRRDKPTQYADWAARNNGGSKPASTYKPATNYTPGGGAQ